MEDVPPTIDTSINSTAIVVAILALLTTLLIIPSMYWHARNRNISATILVAWVVYLNFQTFLNAVIWPSDDIENWYKGYVVCDVESKMMLASSVAIPAALSCILHRLATVMDTDRATIILTSGRKRRQTLIELCICVLLPLVHMVFQVVVQSERYSIFGISGCVPAVDISWVSIILVFVPPLVFMAFAAFYAILILRRLYLYRTTLARILESSSTTKSRFMRLYVLCVIFLAAVVPTQFYVFSTTINVDDYSYDWTTVHEHLSLITFWPSHGVVLYDRYIWLVMGILVFLFFGLGKEAVTMYRNGLMAMGFGRIASPARRIWSGLSGSHNDMGVSGSSSACGKTSPKEKNSFATTTVNTTSSLDDNRSASLSPAMSCRDNEKA